MDRLCFICEESIPAACLLPLNGLEFCVKCSHLAIREQRDYSRSQRGKRRTKAEWVKQIAELRSRELLLQQAAKDKAAAEAEAAKKDARVHIRWMIRRDMPEVLEIEQASLEYPWSDDDFLRCLRQRNCIGMVAEHGEKDVGFMIYELHKFKLHLLNFAVHPQWRRRGVGAQMVAKLVGKLSNHRRTRITLEMRETNLDAQKFFRSQGFRAARVLSKFFEDSGEDAFVMEYRFAGDPDDLYAETPANRIAQYLDEA